MFAPQPLPQRHRGPTLLASAMFFLTAGYTLLGLSREPLSVLGDIDRQYAGVGVGLLCATLVPLYALVLRRWTAARIAVGLTLLLLAGACGVFALTVTRVWPGPACSLLMGLATFAVIHVWSIASDVPVANGLRSLPWVALGGSLGAIVPRLVIDPIWTAVGPAIGVLMAGAAFVVGGTMVAAYGRTGGAAELRSTANQVTPTPSDTGFRGVLRDRHLWLVAGIVLALAALEALTDDRAWFPAGASPWSRAALLAAGAAGVLLIAVPLLRRSLLILLLLWPVAVGIMALSMTVGAPPSSLRACDWALAVTSSVTAVAGQAVLLGSPRAVRYLGRAVLCFWVVPIGSATGTTVAVLGATLAHSVLVWSVCAVAFAAAAAAFAVFAARSLEESRLRG